MTTRESIIARVWANPPTSKRYVPRPTHKTKFGAYVYFDKPETWRVYDQREKRFIPDDEVERIDPDEMLRI